MSRTIVINIDSKYRTNFFNSSSSDFLVNLNYPLTRVTSLKLANVQIPNSWDNISVGYKNNYIILDGNKFSLPDGNYTNITLTKLLRIRPPDTPHDRGDDFVFSTDYKIVIDKNNARTTISRNDESNITINLVDDDSDPRNSLGWLLGFRQVSYSGSSEVKGLSTFNGTPFRYIYLMVDDFNINGAELIVGNLETSFISGNFLGIIRINSGNYGVINTDNYDTQTRRYSKPVNINKLHIKIMDPEGVVINLNQMETSFSLEFTILE
tara:strand:- start:884 stop:1681 length:798 start_codon:yes stop_codon:yes gene_type:complete